MPVERSSSSSADVPSGVRAMLDRLRHFETEEGRLRGLSFQPRPSDVAISTSPKCGTTWMQQICHQLRCQGGADMDSFDEISQVVPYLEVATDCGQDLDAPHSYQGHDLPFRVYKTHAWANHCPDFQRVIVVVRNPIDVVASFYRFFENWFFDAGTVSVDDFANHFWLARDVPETRMQNASYFVHLASWYDRAFLNLNNDANAERQAVLFVCFEDMVENLEREVRRVADFVMPLDACGGAPSETAAATTTQRDSLIRLVTERSSFDFMKAHASKFDEHFTKLHRNAACGLPPPAPKSSSADSDPPAGGGSKIRRGRVGEAHDLVSDEVKQRIQQRWDDTVKPVTGCSTYDDFRLHFRTLQSSSRDS